MPAIGVWPDAARRTEEAGAFHSEEFVRKGPARRLRFDSALSVGQSRANKLFRLEAQRLQSVPLHPPTIFRKDRLRRQVQPRTCGTFRLSRWSGCVGDQGREIRKCIFENNLRQYKLCRETKNVLPILELSAITAESREETMPEHLFRQWFKARCGTCDFLSSTGSND